MRHLFLFTFITSTLIIFRPSLGQQTEKLVLSLTECEALALKTSLIVKSARMGLERSRALKNQASNASFLPKLELQNVWSPVPRARAVFSPTGVLTSPDTSTSFSDLRLFTEWEINWLQPLYTFGKLSNLNKAASYGVEIGEANVELKASDVRLLTRQIYWGLVFGNELLAVIDDALQEVNKAEEKLNEQLDEGTGDATQNDLFKLQIFKYEINKRHREAQKKIAIARSSMRYLLGLDKYSNFELKTQYLDPVAVSIDSLSILFDIAMQNRPELRQLQAGLGASRAMIGVSKSDYYPQLFLAGEVKYNFAQGRDDPKNPWVYNPTNFFRPAIVFGMKMNLNFVQIRDKVRLAQTGYRELESKESLLVAKIKLDVQKKYLELLEAKNNIRESERALKASENWLRSVSMTFDIGLADVKELIDAFKANGTMKGEHLQNIFKFNTSAAELSREIGYDLYK